MKEDPLVYLDRKANEEPLDPLAPLELQAHRENLVHLV